jgi:bifunctional DNA-binding transcriptional regulator/antitoxin component of YhaV-PrlF toxin-antitoxin module
MEYILELSPENQLTIPSEIISQLNLKAGSHFTATTDGAQLLIKWLPFSSLEQARSLDATIKNLQ